MWKEIIDLLPSKMILFASFLSFLIPFLVFKINQKLHKYGDPPWKKGKTSEME